MNRTLTFTLGCLLAYASLPVSPARTLVRFRHPEKKPIQSVRVNGVEHSHFNPVKGDVDISGKSGALTIEALYAPPSPAQKPR